MGTKLIGYISLGYPTLEESLRIADFYLDNGMDVIEIGYPTNNAFLDNEYISGTLRQAYENIEKLNDAFDAIKTLRQRHPDNQLILLMYEHGILKDAGYDNFITQVRECNIKDIILVGCKDEKTKNGLIKEGFKISCYVTYGLPDDEVKNATNSNGFIYLQAKPAGKVRPGCETLKGCISYLRSKGITNAIYAGVGINLPEDVEMVTKSGADGAFIGSALLKKTGNFSELKEYIQLLKKARDNSL